MTAIAQRETSIRSSKVLRSAKGKPCSARFRPCDGFPGISAAEQPQQVHFGQSDSSVTRREPRLFASACQMGVAA